MATYYVAGSGSDSNNGSSGSPWRNLTKAAASVNPGDTVIVKSGNYNSQLSLNTSRVTNTTWKVDAGQTAIIDGGYSDALMSNNTMPRPGSGHLPGDPNKSMITIGGTGIVFDGFTVRNIAGTGITIGSSKDVVIRNCRVDFCLANGIRANSGSGWADDLIIENNVVSRNSVQWLVPGLRGGAAIAVAKGRRAIVRDNITGYCYGEGIDIHKNSNDCLVERNVIHNCWSAHLYIVCSTNNILRNNIVFHNTTRPGFASSKGVSAGIVIGDETQQMGNGFGRSSGNQIYNNIVIGTGVLFNLANGNTYNTKMEREYIGHNTFIGGPRTKNGVNISKNNYGLSFEKNIFENNIVCNVSPMANMSSGVSGILFRNNNWQTSPASAASGSGDIVGNPKLVQMPSTINLGINDTYPDPRVNVNPDNYKLTSSSPGINKASNGSTANGLTPPTINVDFGSRGRTSPRDIGAHEYNGEVIDPEEPPPDPEPPAAPTGLVATAQGTDAIRVLWQPTPTASSYRLQRSPNGSSSWSNVATAITGTSRVDTGLSADTTYYYRLYASNSDGESAASAVVSGKTNAVEDPPPDEIPEDAVLASPMANLSAFQAVGGATTIPTAADLIELDTVGEWMAYTIPGLNIPPGSEIHSCVVAFRISSIHSSPKLELDLRNEADATPLTAGSNVISGMSLTGNAVTWDEDDLNVSTVETPELAAALQAVVDKEGWQAGNGVTLVLKVLSGNDMWVYPSTEEDPLVNTGMFVYYTPPPIDPDVIDTYTIDATSDGFENIAGSQNGSTGISMSQDGTGDLIGMVFTIALPKDTKVAEAYVVAKISNNNNDDPHTSLQLEDTDDAAAVTSSAGNLSSRTLMTDPVGPVWDEQSIGYGIKQLPDMAPQFNALFARAGWEAGNKAAVILTALSDRRLRFNTLESEEANPQLVLKVIRQESEEPPPPVDPGDQINEPDPDDPVIRPQQHRVVRLSGPASTFVMPLIPVRAGPNQLLVVITHLQVNGSTDSVETACDWGDETMTLLSEGVEVNEGDTRQFITQFWTLHNPPFGSRSVTLTADGDVSAAVIEAMVFKGTNKDEPARAVDDEWSTDDGVTAFTATDNTADGILLVAHTTNSDNAPVMVYHGANRRYTSNGGDSATAIAAASGYRYMTEDHTEEAAVSVIPAGGDLMASAAIEILPNTGDPRLDKWSTLG